MNFLLLLCASTTRARVYYSMWEKLAPTETVNDVRLKGSKKWTSLDVKTQKDFHRTFSHNFSCFIDSLRFSLNNETTFQLEYFTKQQKETFLFRLWKTEENCSYSETQD